MSKAKPVAAEIRHQPVRTLQDNELDAVTGAALNAYTESLDPNTLSGFATRGLGSPER